MKMERNIFRAASMLFALTSAYVAISGSDRAFLGPVALLFLLILPAAERLFRFRLGYPLRTCIVLFCLLGFNLGTALRWFDWLWWFDDLAHGLSGILFTVIGLCLYARFSGDRDRRSKVLLQISYAFFFSMFVAVIWEIGEFLGFVIFGPDSQHTLTTGVFDTMEDIIACFAGSLLAALDFWLYQRGGPAPFTRLVISFDKANSNGFGAEEEK